MKLLYLVIVNILAVVLVLINATIFHSLLVGIIAAIIYLAALSYTIKKYFVYHSTIIDFAQSLLLGLAILSLIGGLIYRLLSLTQPIVLAIIALTPFVIILAGKYFYSHSQNNDFSIPQPAKISAPSDWRSAIIIISATTLTALTLAILYAARTSEAIRSPWSIVSPFFFVLIGLTTLITISGLWWAFKYQNDNAKLWLFWIFIIPSLIVGVIVYSQGYGFDPFIHGATEKLILNNGVVDPKPWYYLGQYGLVVILATITNAPIAIIDTLLLPLIASLTLPILLFITLLKPDQSAKDQYTSLLTAITLISLPLPWFIATTPQGLANLALLSLIAVAYCFVGGKQPWATFFIIALTASIIHPLAGIPALIFIAATKIIKTLSLKISVLLSLGLAAVIPIIFLIEERLNAQSIINDQLDTAIADPAFHGLIYLTQRFNLIFDMIYHFAFNLPIFFTIIAFVGIWLAYQKKQFNQYLPFLIMTIILFVDGLALNNFFSFSFLIDYERSAYGDRLITMATFFLLPFIIIALKSFYKSLLKAPLSIIIFCLLALASIRTISLYLTYPRFDTYAYDRGYSTSIHDLKAVNLIEAQARGPYVVLSNQAVAAAALSELGFKQYFNGQGEASGQQIFFYPIPTGGPLYQKYLAMVYDKPSRQTVVKAMDMTGVNEAYFVLNDYWFNSETLQKEAKASADSWQIIDGGKVYIFAYHKK